MSIDGKLRATFNGISYKNPATPIRLADVYYVKGDYKLDFPTKPMNRPPKVDASIINATYKGFIEVILQNNDTVAQSFHMDGYSFFVVGYRFCLKRISFLLYAVSHQMIVNVIICLFASGWVLENGQRTTGDLIIGGMQFLGLQLRFVLYSGLLLYSLKNSESSSNR